MQINTYQPPAWQTSAAPGTTYAPWQTQIAANQQVGALGKSNNLPYLLKSVYSPNHGISIGPAAIARTMQPMAQYGAQKATIPAMQNLQDANTNANAMLGAQQVVAGQSMSLLNMMRGFMPNTSPLAGLGSYVGG